jgi:patatin-like phospholipase/acyl hydrolase
MPKFLLSVDGGGVRIIIVLYFLQLLEQNLLKKYNKRIFDLFDFYAGTSAGSMLLSLIAYSKFKSINEIINIFSEETMKEVFTKNTSFYSMIFSEPEYRGEYKTKLLNKYLGTFDIKDTSKYTLFTVYSVTDQKPMFYKSYDFDTIRYQSYFHKKINLDKIIDASSSPPSYFSSVKYNDTEGIKYGIDGAVFANNPCDSAYADCLRLFNKNEDIRILSIGTGSTLFNKLGSETKNWGALQWATKGSIFNVILETDPILVDYKMKHFTNALGHKYIRIEEPVHISIDDVSKYNTLKEIGIEWYSKYGDQVLKLFGE